MSIVVVSRLNFSLCDRGCSAKRRQHGLPAILVSNERGVDLQELHLHVLQAVRLIVRSILLSSPPGQ